MHNVVKEGIYVFLIIGTCCILPFFLLLYLGYFDRVEINENRHETTCNILELNVHGKTCSYEDCDDYGNCEIKYYTCYDARLKVRYEALERYRTGWLIIYRNKNSHDRVERKLNKRYEIGTNITCYYDIEAAHIPLLKDKPTTVYLVFAIIFAALGGLIFLGWLYCIIDFSTLFEKTKDSIVDNSEKVKDSMKSFLTTNNNNEELDDQSNSESYISSNESDT